MAVFVDIATLMAFVEPTNWERWLLATIELSAGVD